MSSLHKIATLLLIALFAFPAAVLAKRIPAPVVEPIIHNGVRYTVPKDNGTKGYVVAWDAATGKQLWRKTIFKAMQRIERLDQSIASLQAVPAHCATSRSSQAIGCLRA